MELFSSGLVVLASFVALSAWWDLFGIFKAFRRWKLYRAIPTPKKLRCHWLLGHIPALMDRNESFWGRLEELQGDKIGLHKLYVGPFYSYVNIVHPKHVPMVLKEPKSSDYQLLLPWLGEGLLISEGRKWFRNRRLLTPAFHYSILKNYCSVYNHCTTILISKWEEYAKMKVPVKVFQDISSLSLDTILQCAFSFKSECQVAEKRHPYVEACCELAEHCSDRFYNVFYQFDWIYWWTPHGRRMKLLCDKVHKHSEKVIAKRKATLSSSSEGSEISGKNHYDFLDILLIAKDEDGEGMSDLEIRNEVDTFMFEGHDTTTSGMSWTLYCLAQYPEHQEKIREEVRGVLKGRHYLEYNDLKQLNYTMWCIKEAMRLYPPVYMFSRLTKEEMKIGEYVIPESTEVSVQVFQIHRNPAIWKNPSVFDPLRFQPSNMEKHGPYDYIPFSAGSRNCIGQNFAMNEMKLVIGTLARHFQFSVHSSHIVEVQSTLILKAQNDVQLFLECID